MMSAQCPKTQGKLTGKFADVFGSLDEIEAKHDTFVKTTLKDTKISYDDRESDDPGCHMRKRARRQSDYASHSKRSEGQSSAHGSRSRMDTSRSHRGYSTRGRAWRNMRGRGGRVPDYKVHPDKWVCYDLSDVDNSQLSERANSTAAFSFLNQLRHEKQTTSHGANDASEAESTSGTENAEKIVFKKPTSHNILPASVTAHVKENETRKIVSVSTKSTGGTGVCDETTSQATEKTNANLQDKSSSTVEKSTSSYVGGKLVMPEYVVGANKNKKIIKQPKIAPSPSTEAGCSTTLNSLSFAEDLETKDDETSVHDVSREKVTESVAQNKMDGDPIVKFKSRKRNLRRIRHNDDSD